MATFDLVKGDGGSVLTVTIKDRETGTMLNLTGKTATLRYTLNGGAAQQRSMTVLNQTTSPGQVQYQFLTSDLSAAGELVGDVVIQSGESDQLTTVEALHLRVKSAI